MYEGKILIVIVCPEIYPNFCQRDHVVKIIYNSVYNQFYRPTII